MTGLRLSVMTESGESSLRQRLHVFQRASYGLDAPIFAPVWGGVGALGWCWRAWYDNSFCAVLIRGDGTCSHVCVV